MVVGQPQPRGDVYPKKMRRGFIPATFKVRGEGSPSTNQRYILESTYSVSSDRFV